jgi:hypothetical protein
MDFGGGYLDAPNGYYNAYVAKLDGNGTHLWSKSLGGTSNDEAHGVAVDPSDDVVLTGFVTGTVDLGAGPASGSASSDVFVVKYSPAGLYQWSRRFGGTGQDMGHGIATDPDGNVMVVGAFTGTVDFGSGALTAPGVANATDAFAVKLSSAGSTLWSKRFGDVSADSACAIAVDVSGVAAVMGSFYGTADLGYGPATSLGASDAFVTTIAP